MTEKTKKKAKEFAEAITESQEYKELIRASNVLEKSDGSRQILVRFQEKQMELRAGNFSPEIMEELQSLQMKINQSRKIQDFAKAQQELVLLLRRTNNIISGNVGVPFALPRRGGFCG